MKLVADRLACARGGRILFSDLSFVIEPGTALILVGPNGAGKTSLIRIVAGLLAPTAGRVAIEGGKADCGIEEQCHYVGHLNAVKTSLTVEVNVGFWRCYLGGGPARVENALAAFGLAALRDIPAGYLSAGQRRRLGLARVLAAERPIWLLDEPTTSLDSASQDMLATAVNAHLAGGGLVMAATHTGLGFSSACELRLGATASSA